MIFLRSYCIQKVIWLKTRLKVQKGWKRVNIKFGRNSDVENIVLCKGTSWYRPQELSHYQEVGCHTPSFDHDLLQKVKVQGKVSIELVKDFDVENIYNIFIHTFYTKIVKYLNYLMHMSLIICNTSSILKNMTWSPSLPYIISLSTDIQSISSLHNVSYHSL